MGTSMCMKPPVVTPGRDHDRPMVEVYLKNELVGLVPRPIHIRPAVRSLVDVFIPAKLLLTRHDTPENSGIGIVRLLVETRPVDGGWGHMVVFVAPDNVDPGVLARLPGFVRYQSSPR